MKREAAAATVAVTLCFVGLGLFIAGGDIFCGDNGCPQSTWDYEPLYAKLGLALFTAVALVSAGLAFHPELRPVRSALLLFGVGFALHAGVLALDEVGKLPQPDPNSCNDTPQNGAQTTCAVDPWSWDLLYFPPLAIGLAGSILLLRRGHPLWHSSDQGIASSKGLESSILSTTFE